MKNLDGKKVLLTGGLGTLGRAQATELAAAGADVVVLDLPDSNDAEARSKALGATVSFLACDLNDLAGAQRTVTEAARQVGGFDILINNAALIINRPFQEFSLE